MSCTIDCRSKATRAINQELREAIAAGQREISVLQPDARHNLGVALLKPVCVVFDGSVGYYCGGMMDGAHIEVRGSAGFTPQNNIYSFDIKPVGMRAVVHYWASGDLGTDTHGRIFLHTPDGKEVEIGTWSPKDFNTVTTRVASYKQLREKTCDISKYVTVPGEYKVEFRFTGGGFVLSILRVEIDVK